MTWGSSAAFRFAMVASTRDTSSNLNRSSVLYCPQRMREKLTMLRTRKLDRPW